MTTTTTSWKPGSKVTASALAGAAMTVIWDLVMQFDLISNPRPTLVAGSVTFVMMAVAYFKKEKRSDAV